jgi:hypothetical protein
MSCGAIIHAVETPQPQMGQFPTNDNAHVEAENLDAAEIFDPEGGEECSVDKTTALVE